MNRIKFILCFIFLSTFSLLAFAEDVPKVGDAIIGLISAIKVGTIGAILLAAGQLLKSDFVSGLLGKVNTKYLPWITTCVGIVIAVGTSLTQGKPWYVGALEGLLAGLISNGVFDHTKATQA